jgi:hypothetical protein
MTAQQPQREYIIKEADLMEICRVISLRNPQLAKAAESVVKSRPHIPAPDCSKMPLPVCDTCELEWTQCGLDSIECHRTMIEHIKIEAARAATLAAYDKFLDEVRNEEYENCGYVDMDSVEAVWNSLRTTAQQQEARR